MGDRNYEIAMELAGKWVRGMGYPGLVEALDEAEERGLERAAEYIEEAEPAHESWVYAKGIRQLAVEESES